MVWAIWQGYLLLKQEQLGIQPAVKPIVIIASILLLICSFMISTAIGNLGDKNLRSQQFSSRLAIYEKSLSVWLLLVDEVTDETTSRLHVEMNDLDAQLLLIAPGKVLKAYQELKELSATRGLRSDAARDARKKLVAAMREDLGQPSDYIARKELQNLLK